MSRVYVILTDTHPIAARATLAAAQAYAEQRASAHRQHPVDTHWTDEARPEGIRVWHLHTATAYGGWTQTRYTVHDLPIS